jgi:hypothetical protein
MLIRYRLGLLKKRHPDATFMIRGNHEISGRD